MTILNNREVSFNIMASLQLKEKNVMFMPEVNKLEQNYELFCQSNLLEKDTEYVAVQEDSPGTSENNLFYKSNEMVTSKYSKNTKQSNKKSNVESSMKKPRAAKSLSHKKKMRPHNIASQAEYSLTKNDSNLDEELNIVNKMMKQQYYELNNMIKGNNEYNMRRMRSLQNIENKKSRDQSRKELHLQKMKEDKEENYRKSMIKMHIDDVNKQKFKDQMRQEWIRYQDQVKKNEQEEYIKKRQREEHDMVLVQRQEHQKQMRLEKERERQNLFIMKKAM